MLELKNSIFYVGVKDPEIRVCDIIIKADYGTTYNAYIVCGDKTALIDGVHEKFSDEFIHNIEQILPKKNIDYIICNHSEPNHSGSIKKILEINPDITIVGTIAALKNLKEITNTTFNEMVAKEGKILDLGGGKALRFVIAPNLHWPDTMMTYELSEKILFSCDVFGAHYCEGVVYDSDIVYSDKYENSVKDYYQCIMSPFKGFAAKAIDKIKNFEVDMICTGHGPIIKKGVDNVIKKYEAWSKTQISSVKMLAVFYASTYGYTREMADIIVQTALRKDINVTQFDIQESDESEIEKALNSADALAFGSPTINRNALKPIWDLISQLDMVNRKGVPCMVFGSYGWSGEALHYLYSHLNMLHLKTFEKPFGSVFRLSDDDRKELEKYTKRFIESI